MQASLDETAIPDAAEFTGIPETELEELVEAEQVRVGPGGHVAFIDPAPKQAPSAVSATESFTPLAMPIPGTPAGGSRPGAPVTVFLDFDGAIVEKTSWNVGQNSEGVPAEARYELAGAAVADDAFKAEVWARIAEDYAPFNINVTTTDPGPDALFKTSASDTTYGSWLVITDDNPSFRDGSGGIASYQGAGSKYHAPAFVFAAGMGGGNPADATAKAVAEAGSHEIGHNFGLDHDGIGAAEYYSPSGGLWGPLMGAPYESPLTQWSKGDYAGATRAEDDLSLITDRAAAQYKRVAWERANGEYYYGPYCTSGGEPTADGDKGVIADDEACGTEEITAVFTYTDRADYAADDHGDNAAGATALDNASTAFTTNGVIGATSDVDVFKITTNGGPVTAQLEVANVGPNLDAKLTLTNSNGTVLAENAPVTEYVDIDNASGLGAQVSATVPAGIYYLTVDGVGQGDPNDSGSVNLNGATAYTDYGSLGHYRLTGAAAPFVAVPIDIVTPTSGATVTGGAAFAVSGTAHPGATVTLTVGAAVVTTAADAAGAWTANVTANATGATTVVASETVGGIEVAATDTVTVNAEVAAIAAPVISAPGSGSETGTKPTFSGTGTPGAVVTVTVTSAGGEPITLTATVDANGQWSVAAGSDLAAGTYSATASQSLDGQTSPASNRVSFTVKAASQPGTGNSGGSGNAGADGPGNPSGALPATGSESGNVTVGIVGGGLLLASAMIVIAAIRQRRGTNAN